MQFFVGRKTELNLLSQLLTQPHASLVIIKGRRRIGKSRLVKQFAKDMKFYSFAGIPPTKHTTAQTQRNEFARQLKENCNLPLLKGDDWGDLFTALAKHTHMGRVVILFDEISWMGSKDSDFLGKLKNAWDNQFSQNNKLILILCGSVSSWIEKNIINSTGFVGRPALYLTLDELSLPECNQFLSRNNHGISIYEKLKILAITGGVPRYLELVNPKLTAEDNIRTLCFNQHGPLVNEFEQIFTDIFTKKSDHYKQILECLIKSHLDQESLAKKLGISRSGDLGDYLKDLEMCGFIIRDFTWHIKTGAISKLSYYRLKDNYIRFYLKYILPNKARIQKNIFDSKSLTTLPAWDSVLGLQFENLVLNNHQQIKQALSIASHDVVFDNPFFQRKTERQPGCQIDYLIQTQTDCVYICEIKFSRKALGIQIIQEMRDKIKNIKLPKHFSFRPVLIHVNGVSEELQENNYFSHIIDFGKLLNYSSSRPSL